MATPETGTPTNAMKKIAIASCTGTTIEFYDFFIYGTAAALVFGKLFFPALGPAAGTVAAFATFGVAFVARPFGSILFGHFGDRVGRKKTLIATLLLMGLSTVAIGLMPTAGAIGAAAPVVVVFLRILQGLAVGGEWAGATLLTAENAPKARRGFYAMFPQLGPAIAFTLASATFLVTALAMSDEAFLAYGWRIPFIASILLVGVGLYVRINIDETPVFRGELAAAGAAKVPFVEALRHQTREVLLGAGMMTMIFAFFYIAVSYLTSYGTTVLGLGRPTVLALGIAGGVAFALTIAGSAVLSDRVGRRRVVIWANAAAIAWALLLFPILDTGSPVAFGIGLCVTLAIVGVSYGPVGAYLPELFSTRHRYTGAGLAYNLAGVLGGAIPPLLAAALAATYGGAAIGWYLAAMAALSLVCTIALGETREADLENVQPAPAPAST
ncbi:MAG: MFS transporter [Pseudonocardia sp.]